MKGARVTHLRHVFNAVVDNEHFNGVETVDLRIHGRTEVSSSVHHQVHLHLSDQEATTVILLLRRRLRQRAKRSADLIARAEGVIS